MLPLYEKKMSVVVAAKSKKDNQFILAVFYLCWRSQILSSMCAKLRTASASNNRDHNVAISLTIACSCHAYIFLFFAHIPFVVNHTINATPPKRLQQHPLLSTTNRTDRMFFLWRLNLARPPHPGHSTSLLMCLSLCNTQARTVYLIHAILCDDEGVTQAHGCLRHETDRGVERWHCTICCLQFCAGFDDAKRQHPSTINTNSDLSFTTIQKQTYRRKQLMDQSDDNSLTALLTKRDQVKFREVVSTCTERRVEKRIQRTAWILSHVLRTTLCEHVNGLCPAGWLSEQSITKHWFQSVRTCPYSWATGRNTCLQISRSSNESAIQQVWSKCIVSSICLSVQFDWHVFALALAAWLSIGELPSQLSV